MKNIILLIVLIITNLTSFCQPKGWQTVIEFTEDIIPMDIQENYNDEFYITARVLPQNAAREYSLVYKLNNAGELLNYSIIKDSLKSLNIFSLGITEDNLLYAFGSSFDSLTKANVSLLKYKLNDDLEVLQENSCAIEPELRFDGFLAKSLNNSEFLYHGSVFLPNNRFTAYVAQLDSSFNLLKWSMPDAESLGIYFDFKKLNDTSYWALKVFPWKFEILDTSFNILDFSIIPDQILGNTSCKWVNDSSFYLIGQNASPLPGYNLALIKQFHPIDTTGHLFRVWHHSDTIDFPPLWQGIDLKHPDTIFAGGTRNMSMDNPYFGYQPSWFVVFQTDSLLNLRWERFYGGNAYYLMTNLKATKDGGCLIGGTRFQYEGAIANKREIFLLKINSEGLINSVIEMPEFQAREAIIYPNPGNKLQIRLAIQHSQAQLRLFDQAGHLVVQQQLHQFESIIETSHLPAGVYLYQLTAPTGLNENGKWVKE
ncbi:MAG: T9SS type A sorting domain-containing protein [Bacteroidales bacterium]|nr:T9SS type A sorting domain-containing protein [Acholeplasmataceae bacterium]MCK9450010.1 T9SS type A sorting domain-containing protein [Bacteroidales bacterium]